MKHPDKLTPIRLPPAQSRPVDFLRQRLAMAIERGDDETATRLIRQLNELLNGTQVFGGP